LRAGRCKALLDAVRRAVGRLRLPPRSYIVVFGSVAEGRCSRLSDIDLAVRGLSFREVEKIAEAVEKETGRRVDIVPLESAGLPLLYKALGRGVFVAGDHSLYVEDKWRATLRWLDYAEAYERMHRAYRRRVLAAPVEEDKQ